MKTYLLLPLLIILLITAKTGYTQDSTQRSRVPYSQQTIAVGSSSLAVIIQVPRSQTAAIPLIHFSSSQPSYAMNHLKGDFGETIMRDCFTSKLLKATDRWSSTTPARTGRAGIDGLYLKLDRNGLPRNLLIADAKYGSAKLGVTRDGVQMSDNWIKPRLRQTSQMYRDLAAEIKNKKISLVSGSTKNRATNRITIPINDTTDVEIWRNKRGIQYFCKNKNISSPDIHKQLLRISNYLDGAADGKSDYRRRLFSYKPNGKEHQFIIRHLDKNGKIIPNSRQSIIGEFGKLPLTYQGIIERAIKHTLLSYGKSGETPIELTNILKNDPEKFNRLCIQPKGNIFAGLDKGAFKIAGGFTVLSIGVDVIFQYAENKEIDVGRTVTMGGLTFGSIAAGNYAGTQASILLSRTSPLAAKFGGGAIGGGVASVLIGGGLWITGNADGKTAAKVAASGIIMSGVTSLAYAAPQIAAWYAATYGVTSGGVAISSLGGAAKTSAILAYWGGGSLAAGGGGMAEGATVLKRLSWTGPAIIAIGIAYTAYSVHRHFKNDADHYRYLAEIVRITQERVNSGQQQEWQNN
jgi:hypothetical protein